MKRLSQITLAIIILLAMAGTGWGATILVSNDPNNAGKVRYIPAAHVPPLLGDWPTAGNSPTTNTTLVAAATAAGTNGTVILDGGTFTGTQLNAQHTYRSSTNNISMRGALASDNPPTAGGTIISGDGTAGAGVVRPDVALFTLQNVTLQTDNDVGYGLLYSNKASVTYNLIDVFFNGGKYPINLSDTSATCILNMTRVKIKYANISGTKAILGPEGMTVTGNYCIFDGNLMLGFIDVRGNVTLNNPTFVNHASMAINVAANPSVAKVLTVYNGTFNGNALAGSTTNVITKTAAYTNYDVVLNNCYTQPNPWDADNYGFFNTIGTAYTQNNCVNTGVPKFKSPKYPAILVMGIDDIGARASGYLTAVSAVWAAYGYKGIWAINHTDIATADDWTGAQAFVTAGNEAVCHTRYHWPLSILTTFAINKAGLTIGISSNTLTPSAGSPYNLASFTLSSLRTQLIADGYTCGADPATTMPATVLADVAPGTSINTAYTLNLNETKLFQLNIDPSKTDIQNGIGNGYVCSSFVPPGNNISANLRTYLKDTAGFLGARGASNDVLASINIFNIGYRELSTTFGITTKYEAAGGTRANGVKRNVAAWLEKMNAQGGVFALYAHSTTDFTVADWQSLCAAVAQSNVQVMTLAQAIAYCKTYDPSADLATADGFTYTRTLIDGSDFHLQPSSPCIDAGVSVGLTTDFAGNPVPNLLGHHSIGAYQYWEGGGGGLGMNLGLH